MWEYFQNMTMGLIYVYEYDFGKFTSSEIVWWQATTSQMFNKQLGLNTVTHCLNPLFYLLKRNKHLNILKLPENKLKLKSTSTSHHQWYAIGVTPGKIDSTLVTPGKIVKETSSFEDAVTRQTTQS